MKKIFLPMLASALILFGSSSVSAQTKVRVKFPKGATSTVLKGRINGYRYIDYIVRARSGQTMTVALDAADNLADFDIFYSDMKNVDGATEVKEFMRNVDVDDDYIVRVLQPRSAARRKESASFTLKIEIQ